MVIFSEKYVKKALALTIDTAFYNDRNGLAPIVYYETGDLRWYIDAYRAWSVPANGLVIEHERQVKSIILESLISRPIDCPLTDTGMKKVIERRKNGKSQKSEIAIFKAEDGREVGLNAGFLKLYDGVNIALTDGGKEESAVLVHDLTPDGEVFGVMMPVRLKKE